MQSLCKNSPSPLSLNVLEKNTQVVHPSVIDFKSEHQMESWGQFRYWMALTPYPYGKSGEENPCICVSNDGVNWYVPNGISNPLDVAEGGWKLGFHSDTDMIYNPDRNELWIYYRFLTYDIWSVKLVKISESHQVSAPETIMQLSYDAETELKSMAVWRESSDKWHMWCGKGRRYTLSSIPCDTVYLSSSDGKNWSKPLTCLNAEGQDSFVSVGYSHWHISAKPNHEKEIVEFVCFCDSLNAESSALVYAYCPMDFPTMISCPENPIILLQSGNGWDNGSLYRCSFVREDDILRIWYSATKKRTWWQRLFRPFFLLNKYLPFVWKLHPKWYIGYTEGKL